jgi:biopolymer transport protein ExbD
VSQSSSEGLKADPNLTPLLDMVLQLVMFFMVCANFVMEELNTTILLPSATTAASLDKGETDVLFLNVDEQGRLLPLDGSRQPMADPRVITQYLRSRFEIRVKGVEDPEQGKRNAKQMLIVIRAHASAKTSAVYEVMKACKLAGFERIQLRAMRKN